MPGRNDTVAHDLQGLCASLVLGGVSRMSKPVYSDEMYHDAMVVVVGDIIYSNASCDSKIGRIRKLTEYIVRRLTKYNPNSSLELGDDRTIVQA